jgi:integrase
LPDIRSADTSGQCCIELAQNSPDQYDNGLLAPELAAGISRVQSAKTQGIRTGNWLSQRQAQALLSTPDISTLRGLRDRAILAVLLGCGLRRSEVAALTFAHLQQRDGRWCIVDLVGKHARVRTAPMPNWVKAAIDAWTTMAGLTEDHVFRPVLGGDRVASNRLGEKVVWQMLREYAAEMGIPGIAPHDLRRTCAKLCRAAGGELEQIQLLLGHASVQTTEALPRDEAGSGQCAERRDRVEHGVGNLVR